MCSERIARVAVEGLAYHFDMPYSYCIPRELEAAALPGCRVLVPFGNGNRKRQGLILCVCDSDGTEDSVRKCKAITAVLDEAPLFDDTMLSLVSFLKERTFCTLYEAAKAMLPAGIGLKYVVSFLLNPDASAHTLSRLSEDEKSIVRYLTEKTSFVKRETLLKALGFSSDCDLPERLLKKGVLLSNVDARRKTGDSTVRNVRSRLPEDALQERLGQLTVKQKSVMKLLMDIGCASQKEVCYFTGVTPAVITALEKKGLVELFDSEVYRRPRCEKKAVCAPDKLTASQQQALEVLLNSYHSPGAAAALLYGVTGSGKTQVFLKLIEQTLQDGKDCIVMVPEISLTPQTLGIFYAHFGDSVAVFHSALSAGERMDEWKRVKSGAARIAVGTRSAVFAPVKNLGLIVMDEEQEHTYKSEMTPRFHARDVARFRCAATDALLVLASATPSMESYRNALEGRYALATLPERYGKAVLPEVVTVDTTDCKGVLSGTLCHMLEETLSAGKQAILLMNRRGFNTFAVCNSCKKVLSCPNCSISLTYHSANHRLMCHYCGYSEPLRDTCPECGEKTLRYAGVGTQRIEEELSALFPEAKILRMDADTTMSRYSYEEKLSAFAKGDYNLLLGTQMVAKGLDFPNVTLVGIVSIDQQLFGDDFRSGERAFDLLTQVIGRSGRGESAGKAIVQTVLPDNEIITLAAKQDFDAFYKTESVIRQAMTYPPYCDICAVSFYAASASAAYKGAADYLERMKTAVRGEYAGVKLQVLGPLQPRVGRINNKYRYILNIKCKNNKSFRALTAALLKEFMRDAKNAGVTVTADMNPLG